MKEISCPQGTPIGLVFNESLQKQHTSTLQKAGYLLIASIDPCVNKHNLRDLRGACIGCNPHILKSLAKDANDKTVHIFESSCGGKTQIILASSKAEAVSKVDSGLSTALCTWAHSSEMNHLVGIDGLNTVSTLLKDFEHLNHVEFGGEQIHLPFIYDAPTVLITAILGQASILSSVSTSNSMFDKIEITDVSVVDWVSDSERKFLDEIGISLDQCLNAKGMKTGEYKMSLLETGKIIAINAYPCNAHSHRMRNVNNACVMCHPDKTLEKPFTKKTPEIYFLENNKIPQDIVLDLKLSANKNFKEIMPNSVYKIAIHTYRCKKCGMGIRNETGSCLNCKKGKLKDILK